MKIDTMSREDLKELMKEVMEEILDEMSVDNDGEIKPEVRQQLLEIRARRQHDDRTPWTVRLCKIWLYPQRLFKFLYCLIF